MCDLNTYYADCTLDVGTDDKCPGNAIAVLDGKAQLAASLYVSKNQPNRRLLLTKSALRLTMRGANVKKTLRLCAKNIGGQTYV